MIRKKRFLPFKLYTTYLQEKSNYKKSYAYLTYSQYSTCLLKKYPYLQHSSESKDLQACKMPDVFFWLIFLVSSPPSMTNFHILHPQTLLLEHIFIRHKVNSNWFEIWNGFEKSLCLHGNLTTTNLEVWNKFQKLFRLHGNLTMATFKTIVRFHCECAMIALNWCKLNLSKTDVGIMAVFSTTAATYMHTN